MKRIIAVMMLAAMALGAKAQVIRKFSAVPKVVVTDTGCYLVATRDSANVYKDVLVPVTLLVARGDSSTYVSTAHLNIAIAAAQVNDVKYPDTSTVMGTKKNIADTSAAIRAAMAVLAGLSWNVTGNTYAGVGKLMLTGNYPLVMGDNNITRDSFGTDGRRVLTMRDGNTGSGTFNGVTIIDSIINGTSMTTYHYTIDVDQIYVPGAATNTGFMNFKINGVSAFRVDQSANLILHGIQASGSVVTTAGLICNYMNVVGNGGSYISSSTSTSIPYAPTLTLNNSSNNSATFKAIQNGTADSIDAFGNYYCGGKIKNSPPICTNTAYRFVVSNAGDTTFETVDPPVKSVTASGTTILLPVTAGKYFKTITIMYPGGPVSFSVGSSGGATDILTSQTAPAGAKTSYGITNPYYMESSGNVYVNNPSGASLTIKYETTL